MSDIDHRVPFAAAFAVVLLVAAGDGWFVAAAVAAIVGFDVTGFAGRQ